MTSASPQKPRFTLLSMLGLAFLVLVLIALSWWMGQQAYH